jgi:hypothetical protein
MMMQSESPYGIRTEELNHAKGSVPLLLAPLYLVFRPGRFMLGYGYHASVFVVLLAAWVIGAGGMTSSVINRAQFNALPAWAQINSWGSVFALLFGLGLLRGALHYGLGGLWTWLLVYICGLRGNQWRLSTRLYCFPRLIEEVPALLGVVYMALRYQDLGDALGSMSNTVPLVVMLFLFITPGVRFCMLLACGRVRVVWSILLFLVLPYMWRLALVLSVVWMMYQGGGRDAGPYPDTQHPEEHISELIHFDAPDGWAVEELQDAGGAIPISRRVLGDGEFAELVLRVQRREEVDPIEHDLAQIEAKGRLVTHRADDPNVRIANQVGDGIDYTVIIDGKAYKMYHFLVRFDVDHDVLFRLTASEQYWWRAMEGWKQVLGSIEIGDLYGIVPDVSNTTLVEGEGFELEMPGNWHRVDWGRAPFTHNTQIAAKQYSWFVFSIYERDMSAEEELRMFLDHSIDDKIIESRPMNEWLGLKGYGVEGVIQESLAGKQRIKVLYVPLQDGRVLVIDRYQAESSADLTEPGFQLIEDTFQLRGIEPASP